MRFHLREMEYKGFEKERETLKYSWKSITGYLHQWHDQVIHGKKYIKPEQR
jgi:hypothetical protein